MSDTSLRLPALRADDPLGFLAALGLVALSEQEELAPLRLAWEGAGAPVAVIAGYESVSALADDLAGVLERLRTSDAVIPGVPGDFPVATAGSGSDAMRMDRGPMRQIYQQFDDAWRRGDPWPARWLIATAAQAALRQATKGAFVELTPFYAPSGLMRLRTALFQFPLEATVQVGGPGDVLTRWVRTARYSGGNFDERALRDAAANTDGEPQNLGAPSPTWLAAMAVRFFPLADNGRSATALGWRRFSLYPGYTNRSLTWPAWEPLLDAAAVRTLLAHPALALTERARYDIVPARPAELEALGVTALFGTSRRTLSQGDGPLGPAKRIWAPS